MIQRKKNYTSSVPEKYRASNLLQNSDFSAGLDGWTVEGSVTLNQHDGNNCARFDFAGDHIASMTQVVPVVPADDKYLVAFEVAAASSESTEAVIDVGFLTYGPFSTIHLYDLTPSPTVVFLELTGFAEQSRRIFGIGGPGQSGRTWSIDNVVLSRTTEPQRPEMIRNGDFSAGDNGVWGKKNTTIAEIIDGYQAHMLLDAYLEQEIDRLRPGVYVLQFDLDADVGSPDAHGRIDVLIDEKPGSSIPFVLTADSRRMLFIVTLSRDEVAGRRVKIRIVKEGGDGSELFGWRIDNVSLKPTD